MTSVHNKDEASMLHGANRLSGRCRTRGLRLKQSRCYGHGQEFLGAPGRLPFAAYPPATVELHCLGPLLLSTGRTAFVLPQLLLGSVTHEDVQD